jgi:hypothetical protein
MVEEWIIEYWNDQRKTVECFSISDGKWVDAPKENVIFVHVQRHGVMPYGRPEKVYKMTQDGLDHYFCRVIEDQIVFGGWCDDEDVKGVLTYWDNKEWMRNEVIFTKPDFILDEEVKHGVFVPEPYAAQLGWTTKQHRTIESPCDDILS